MANSTLDSVAAVRALDARVARAVHTLDEVISVPGRDVQFRPVIATNVYQCIDGFWFIVEHHASIDASEPPAGPAAGTTRH